MPPIDGRAVIGMQKHRGSNQVSLKAFNERLVINLIQDVGALSKAEIARVTGLSAQTVAIIVNRLIDEGLLLKKAAVKGKIGQPSTPIELNPDGAISTGIKIGRRSVEVMAIGLTRAVIAHETRRYEAPEPMTVMRSINEAYAAVSEQLTAAQHENRIGAGIAAPSGLGGWNEVIGLAEAALSGWLDIDIKEEMEAMTGMPCHLVNDATSACLAELAFGDLHCTQNMAYFYIGTFIGGGLVLDGQLIEGRTGNAAAVGSIPLGLADGSKLQPPQLIERASLQQLEKIALETGLALEDFFSGTEPSSKALRCFELWADEAANAIAFSALGVAALVESESVVIDGVLPRNLIQILAEKTMQALSGYNAEGIALPEVFVGKVGSLARVFGASVLPQRINFALDDAELMRL